MSLTFKKEQRENLQNIKVYVEDNTPLSPNFFRVSDVPQILQKGKNLLRIKAHPTNLVDGSQVLIDVRDSNGNPIYFEIPNYIEDDKSRIISIWIYHDKGDDNTPNGNATITIVGESKVDLNGNAIPDRFKGEPNIRWSTEVLVDRDKNNLSPVVFNPTSLPSVSISESIDSYQNLPFSGTELTKVSSGTIKVRYIYKGNTPIAQKVVTTGNTFNGEMVGSTLDFDTPTVFNIATPTTDIPNPLSLNYNPTIISVVDSNTVILDKPYTTEFQDRTDLVHTFNFVDEIRASVSYFSTASNQTTENKRSYANITLSNVDPMVGLVEKVKVLIKSDGLPGDYELLHEVQVPFSSSFTIKVPIPSEHLKDAKKLRLQYLNYGGEISKTLTTSEPYVFQGGNYYFAGNSNLVTGSMYLSNTIGSGVEMAGKSSGFIKSVGYLGQTSAALGTGPGGFIMYSGSSNLILGSDTLNGVGLQLVGDNDDRHMIFTTTNGGLLDIKADKFFIGNTGSQFISGSDGNIEISSSNFHLQPNGNVTMNGTITAGAGNIGGFTITSESIKSPLEISSSINALEFKASGSISGSTLLLRQNFGGTLYTIVDTYNGLADFKNLGRVLVSDNTEYTTTTSAVTTIVEYPIRFLDGETHIGFSFQARNRNQYTFLPIGNTTSVSFRIKTINTGSSAVSSTDYYDSYGTLNVVQSRNFNSNQFQTGSYAITPGGFGGAATTELIPSGSFGRYCILAVLISNSLPNGQTTDIKNINVFATRQFAADVSSNQAEELPLPPKGSS